MANIHPLEPESVPDLAPVFQGMQAVMGFVPNSVLTMARVPGLGAEQLDTGALRRAAGAISMTPRSRRSLR